MQVVRINFCLKFNHEKEVLEVSFLVRRKGQTNLKSLANNK